jgi:hypothetical protein
MAPESPGELDVSWCFLRSPDENQVFRHASSKLTPLPEGRKCPRPERIRSPSARSQLGEDHGGADRDALVGRRRQTPRTATSHPGHCADGSAAARSRFAPPRSRANDTLHTGSPIPKMDLVDLLTKIIATPKQTEIAPLHSRHAIDAHSNRSRTRVHGRAAGDDPNDSTGENRQKHQAGVR